MKRTNLVAIDISDASIKVLQLEEDGSVHAYGTQELEPGIIENGRVVDQDAFTAALIQVLQNTKPKRLPSDLDSLRAVICLPETKLFTSAHEVPSTVRKADLQTYIEDEAKKIIPFDLDELYWDFHLSQHSSTRTGVFVGTHKTDLDLYVKAFHEAGVKPSFVGSELFCLGRALLPDSFEDAQMVIDMGANTTSIGIFVHDALARSSLVIPRGGSYCSQQLSVRLEIPQAEAEGKKRAQGFRDAPDAEVQAVLQDCIAPIAQEIVAAKKYCEETFGHPVTKVLAAGGSSLIPGLGEFLTKETGLEVTIADPLLKIKGHAVFEEGTPRILFSTVIGLALLSARRDIPRVNLLTQYRYEESDTEKEVLKISDIRSLSDVQYVVYRRWVAVQERMSTLRSFVPAGKTVNAKLLLTTILLSSALLFLAWVIMLYV